MRLGTKSTSQDRVGSAIEGRLDPNLIRKNARFEKITASPVPADGVVVLRPSSWVGAIAAFVFGIAITAFVGAAVWPYEAVARRVPAPQSVKSQSATAAKPIVTEPELWRVAAMTDAELATVDIAYINLLCATGLPGSESLDIPQCSQTLDQWAALVKSQTEKYLYKFQQNPKEYEGKEGYFRMLMLMLVTVLQQDLGVHYNKERVNEVNFTRSQDLFIHGLINSQNGGTCVSMPVLYTAVARRLGYPVRLVLAKAHVFCRWEDGQEKINIEGASTGMHSHPDEYYYKWPRPMTPDELDQGVYLRSLAPREELAVFIAARGHCLQDTGRKAEAFVAYAHAHELDPKLPENLGFLQEAVQAHHSSLVLRKQQADQQRAESYAEFNAEQKLRYDQRREIEMQRIEESNRRALANPFLPINRDINKNDAFEPPNPVPSFAFPQ